MKKAYAFYVLSDGIVRYEYILFNFPLFGKCPKSPQMVSMSVFGRFEFDGSFPSQDKIDFEAVFRPPILEREIPSAVREPRSCLENEPMLKTLAVGFRALFDFTSIRQISRDSNIKKIKLGPPDGFPLGGREKRIEFKSDQRVFENGSFSKSRG
jgi:hypothetical protein